MIYMTSTIIIQHRYSTHTCRRFLMMYNYNRCATGCENFQPQFPGYQSYRHNPKYYKDCLPY